jgi:hypothetical protein
VIRGDGDAMSARLEVRAVRQLMSGSAKEIVNLPA